MVKFLHAADLHLDAPFHLLTAEQGAAQRQAQRDQLGAIANLCQSNQIDLLLLSGDVFDSPTVYRQSIEALHRCFATCGAQVFISPGNHDPFTVSSVWNTEIWESNVHIFTEPVITSVTLRELSCRIYGAGFSAIDCPPLLDGFCVDDEFLSIMVLHGDALQANSPYNPIRPEQIAASGLNYLAFGHCHRYSGLRMAGKTAYAWPGCPQGHGFDEVGAKGVILGSTDAGGTSLHFVPMATMQYQSLEICVHDNPLQEIMQALPEKTENLCCRLILSGEVDVQLPALREALLPRFYSLQIQDKTTVPRCVWDGCGEDNLRGTFLQSLRNAIAQCEDEQECMALSQAAKLGVALLDGREVVG